MTATDIQGHFCGQTQPHAAHGWQTPQVYGSTTLTTYYQCGGYLSPADDIRAQNLRIFKHEAETHMRGHTATCCVEALAAPTQDPTP